MANRIVTYKDQEWPAKRLRKHLATGCVDATPVGILHAIKQNGEMTARQIARIISNKNVPENMTKTEKVIEILELLYEDGRVGIIEPSKQRGRPSYKFVIL